MRKSNEHFAGRLPVEQVLSACAGKTFVAPRHLLLWGTMPLNPHQVQKLIEVDFFSEIETIRPSKSLSNDQNKSIIKSCKLLHTLHIQHEQDLHLLEEVALWPRERPFRLEISGFNLACRSLAATPIVHRPFSLALSTTSSTLDWDIDALKPYLEHIQALDLHLFELSKEGLQSLLSVSAHVTSLTFDHEDIAWKSLQQTSWPALRKLWCYGINGRPINLDTQKTPNLEHLSLFGIGSFKTKGQLPQLHSLKLSLEPEISAPESFLREHLPNVKSWEMEQWPPDPETLPELLALSPRLQHLKTRGIHWKSPQADALAQCPDLNSLSIYGGGLSREFFHKIANINNLKYLSIDSCKIDFKDSAPMGFHLKILHIENTKQQSPWLPQFLLRCMGESMQQLALNYLNLEGVLPLSEMFPALQDLENEEVYVQDASIFHGLEKTLRSFKISPGKYVDEDALSRSLRRWIFDAPCWPHLEAAEMRRLYVFQAWLETLRKRRCPMLDSLTCSTESRQLVHDYKTDPSAHQVSWLEDG